jgi:Autophagocytosis associated protein, active-site domain
MKRLLDHMEQSGTGETMRVDQYLMLFLKFMSAIIPTMVRLYYDIDDGDRITIIQLLLPAKLCGKPCIIG